MLPIHIEKNLEMLDPEKYFVTHADNTVTLVETKTDGWASLKCTVSKNSIVLLYPDKNIIPYLRTEKEFGCRSCPDAFIYQNEDGTDIWNLHIVEFKKTLDTTKLHKSKHQFRMGIYNARAIAALLGLTLGTITVYSAYRNDKNKTNIIEPHAALYYSKTISEWHKNVCTLTIDEISKKYPHVKIQLDQNGFGETII